MEEGERRPGIPETFDRLDERFFSIGQDETYYETLNHAGDQLRSRRRISAICKLRYEDLRLRRGRTPRTVRFVGQARPTRPGLGAAYLFPSPTDPAGPITKDRASLWLLEAEALAKLPKLRGGLWHPYRRKWATARKHLPLTDVAAAGGWRSTETLLRCYQQADESTMLRVVLEGVELREQKA